MNQVKSKVFERLRNASYTEDAHAAGALIVPANVEPLPGTPRLVPVSQLYDIWTVRLANTQTTGAVIQGACSLLPRLRRFGPGSSLEQFSFKGTHGAGNIYFDPETGAFVGFVFRTGPASPAIARARAAAKVA